ncbi:SLBB domain-containing protein [Desulfosediminicola sp.]|uniref:SLBB domain-containing protein n=1 Tax=Desulfosediminicola sp. TaxID=2886825 RepID=UPI003AF315D3
MLKAIPRSIKLLSLLLLLSITYSPLSNAQSINLTPAQLQQLQNLSDEERQALFEQLGGQQGGVRQTQIPEQINTQAAPNQYSNRPSQDNSPATQNNTRSPITNSPISSARLSPAQRQGLPGGDAIAPQDPSLTTDNLQQRENGINAQALGTQAEQEQPLAQYGYDLFSGAPTTFAPATTIPVPANYIMGPGDTVILQLYGQRNLTHELVITREGILMFPEIGPLNVAGLSFQELRDQIQSVVANQLIGQNASITLGALRSINVFVLGEAVQPGSYTVSALSTMTNALFVSGGVTPVGSLRDIRLMRNGELVTGLDLYDLLLRGDTSGDARLQPGDVIFIPPIGKTVGISGEIRRPAIYELREEASPADILALAGGLNPTAFPRASRIERINELGERTVVDVDLSQSGQAAPDLFDGDVIQVYSVLDQVQQVVMLEGHVQRPGPFQWRNGLRVSDVIPSLNSMLPNPDVEYALIAREIQPTRRIELIYVDLGSAINNPGSEADLALEPRDQLHTFGASQNRQEQLRDLLAQLYEQSSFDAPALVVAVTGNVRFPGEYPLVRNMSLGDAIRFAGGLLPDSELEHIMLERRMDLRGSIDVESHSVDANTLRSEASVRLRELDKVIVFNSNTPREALLEETLESLRNQATSSRPTQIVNVAGQVRFPGDYPLTRTLNVQDLLLMAGGLSESADTSKAEITRFDADPSIGRRVGHVELSLEDRGNTGLDYRLTPFDQLVVRQMPNWTEYETVTIGGEVNSPGTYSITKQDTISSLIKRAGGITDYADPRAAIFLREELRDNEQRMIDEFRNELRRDVVTRRLQSSENNADADVMDMLERVSAVTATGRLVINLPGILAGNLSEADDPILRHGDQLLIPRSQQEVSIIGEVYQPTSHLFDRRLSVGDYINRSGGVTQDADRSGIYVIKASGEVVAYGGSRWFFQERSRLNPGDTIIVPFDTYRPNYLQNWTSISQILFNISTTLLAVERVAN